MHKRYWILSFVVTLLASAAIQRAAPQTRSGGGDEILSLNHYVRVKSTAPPIEGQTAELYLHERVQAVALEGTGRLSDRVVLFVHGAGTPAEVAFDVNYGDYSWMAYLAREGFDTFSIDTTGYGRSTRPLPMNDPCNLSSGQQKLFIPSLIAAPCAPSYPGQLTTIASDWNDIDAAVNYIKQLRNVGKISLVGWSLGGPRAGGYAALHPQNVLKLILLAPAYNRMTPAEAPAKLPAPGAAFNTQSRAEFIANWERQAGCPGQYETAVADAVWSQMLDSDPVGATWKDGVRRAPQTTTWGWNAAMVANTHIPALMVTGVNDKQVAPQRVLDLFNDSGASHKVLIHLTCSSHNAMWEKNHLLLFKATVEWLEHTSVNGEQDGILNLGE